MTGTRPLFCGGFIETETFKKSKFLLKQYLEITDFEIDQRLEALVWALSRDASLNAEQVGDRNLWVAVTPYPPRIRIFLRPRRDVPDECELLWIEDAD